MARTSSSSSSVTAVSDQPANSSAAAPLVDCNIVVIGGVLSSAPVVRVLPSGDQLVHYEVTSGAGDPAVPTTSVPVVHFCGEPPKRLGAMGDRVLVYGNVRRRFYAAGGATRSRTEVVAQRLVVSPTKRQRMAVAKRAMSRIGA